MLDVSEGSEYASEFSNIGFSFMLDHCNKNEVLVTFTEEILDGKLHFLCSVPSILGTTLFSEH